MPEVLKQLETLTIPHPGAYDVVVLQGGPVAWFEDNGTPAAVKGSATVESLGRIHLLANGNALVSVAEHVRPVSSRKTAAKQRPAGKTNKPTRSQAGAKAAPKDAAGRRSQPRKAAAKKKGK